MLGLLPGTTDPAVSCLRMMRPDHVWFFFTAVLTLVLAMSIPPRKHAAAYDSTIRELSILQ